MFLLLYKPFNHADAIKIFIRCLGVIYFCTFLSFYQQWPGLYGKKGLLPADDFSRNVLNQFQCDIYSEFNSSCIFDVVQQLPSLFLFQDYINIPSDIFSNFILITSLVCSAALVQYKFNPLLITILITICHMNYMSIINIGQTFTTFQWDILLMEIGFLTIFVSLFNCLNSINKPTSDSTNIGIYALRFLSWKLMFCAGVVKLSANCPTWNALTALEYHFATQPLPTPLAWFAHQLPPILLRIGVAATLIIEIPLTFMLLWNNVFIRRVGVLFQVLLQIFIILTGNYNFFNLLTIVLMIPSWANDDVSIKMNSIISTSTSSSNNSSAESSMGVEKSSEPVTMTRDWYHSIVIMLLSCYYYLNIEIDTNATSIWDMLKVTLKNKYADMQPYMLIASIMGILVACSEGVLHFFVYLKLEWDRMYCVCYQKINNVNNPVGINVSLHSLSQSNNLTRGLTLLKCIYGILCNGASLVFVLCWISLSAFPLREFSPIDTVLPSYVPTLSQSLRSYRIVSGYGLFRVMTGVGNMKTVSNTNEFDKMSKKQMKQFGTLGLPPSIVARPELIVQGLHPHTGIWHEIEFKHKPTSLHQIPSFVAPHQPRLDWQMWFAALGSYNHNAWLVHLVYKLLNGPSIEILNLINKSKYDIQFPNGTHPLEIKILKYDYDFTRYENAWSSRIPGAEFISDSSSSSASPWWYRRNPIEYFPGIRKDNPSLIQFLQGNGFNTNIDIDSNSNRRQCTDKDVDTCASNNSSNRNRLDISEENRCISKLFQFKKITWIFNNTTTNTATTMSLELISIVVDSMKYLICVSYRIRVVYNRCIDVGNSLLHMSTGNDWLCCGLFPFFLLYISVNILNIFV